MRWARLVLPVSLLVGWTSTAAAECAWVLWEEIESTHIPHAKRAQFSTEWELHNAHGTQEECLLAKQRLWTVEAEFYEKLKEGFGPIEEIGKVPGGFLAISGTLKDGTYWNSKMTYRCLPDTIDPREKK